MCQFSFLFPMDTNFCLLCPHRREGKECLVSESSLLFQNANCTEIHWIFFLGGGRGGRGGWLIFSFGWWLMFSFKCSSISARTEQCLFHRSSCKCRNYSKRNVLRSVTFWPNPARAKLCLNSNGKKILSTDTCELLIAHSGTLFLEILEEQSQKK